MSAPDESTTSACTTFSAGTDFSVTNPNYTGSFTLSGTSLTYTLTAVPEPSEFALAIAGLLIVLVVVRRRHLRA